VDNTGGGCYKCDGGKSTMLGQAQFNMQKNSDYVETTMGLIAADKSHYYHVK